MNKTLVRSMVNKSGHMTYSITYSAIAIILIFTVLLSLHGSSGLEITEVIKYVAYSIFAATLIIWSLVSIYR